MLGPVFYPMEEMDTDILRTAILNFIVSRKKKRDFLLRIEDLDIEKQPEGRESEIIQILEKFALRHTLVFHQSEHRHTYQRLAVRLLEEDKAFVCTCNVDLDSSESRCIQACESKEKKEYATLKASALPFVLRVKKPKEAIAFYDLLEGEICYTPDEVESFVILHADGTPSSKFATFCDTMFCNLSMIIQDKKYLEDSAKMIYIHTLLEYVSEIEYLHLPTLKNRYSLKWLFEEGYIPDAIINYLVILSVDNVPTEIFTLPEAIEWFRLDKISRSRAEFNIEKLALINREHLKRMDDKDLSRLFGFADAAIGKLAKLYLNQFSTLKELSLKIDTIFAPKSLEGRWEKEMKVIQDIIIHAPMIDEFNTFKNYIMLQSNLKEEHLINPLRLLLTGEEEGPSLSDIYPLIKSYLLEVVS